MIFPLFLPTQTTLIGLVLPGMPGPLELIILAFIILLLFGKRLPDVMGSLGRSIVEFKKGTREGEEPAPDETENRKHVES